MAIPVGQHIHDSVLENASLSATMTSTAVTTATNSPKNLLAPKVVVVQPTPTPTPPGTPTRNVSTKSLSRLASLSSSPSLTMASDTSTSSTVSTNTSLASIETALTSPTETSPKAENISDPFEGHRSDGIEGSTESAIPCPVDHKPPKPSSSSSRMSHHRRSASSSSSRSRSGERKHKRLSMTSIQPQRPAPSEMEPSSSRPTFKIGSNTSDNSTERSASSDSRPSRFPNSERESRAHQPVRRKSSGRNLSAMMHAQIQMTAVTAAPPQTQVKFQDAPSGRVFVQERSRSPPKPSKPSTRPPSQAQIYPQRQASTQQLPPLQPNNPALQHQLQALQAVLPMQTAGGIMGGGRGAVRAAEAPANRSIISTDESDSEDDEDAEDAGWTDDEEDDSEEIDEDEEIIIQRRTKSPSVKSRGSHKMKPSLPPLARQGQGRVPPNPIHPYPAPPAARRHNPPQVEALQGAALEAQRQRLLFQKLPSRSYSHNLNRYRNTEHNGTASTGDLLTGGRKLGLLSQLMNPDPQIFPVEHPYRRNYSSGDVRNGAGPVRLGLKPLIPTVVEKPKEVEVKQVQLEQSQAKRPEIRHERRPSTPRTPLTPLTPLHAKSAAPPVAAQINAGSVTTAGIIANDAFQLAPPPVRGPLRRMHTDNGGVISAQQTSLRSPYRPKGPPKELEMDDDSSSEEEDNKDNKIQVSRSVAEQQLKAFVEKRGIARNGNGQSDPVAHFDMPSWAAEPVPQQRSVSEYPTPKPAPIPSATPIVRASSQPLGYPYNLPNYAEPSSPRTTRQLMLRQEMSESLRQNLLWSRQLQRNDLLGPRRKSSGAMPDLDRPVEGMMKPVVQLRQKKPKTSAASVEDKDDFLLSKSEVKRTVLARNKSFGDMYHQRGW
ncbi:hypothetical protein C8J56DRAFT_1050565 [Mycena floridula]|nr:hypothetical protein C8J56DRAFT_1050565 [Mycena floridula]